MIIPKSLTISAFFTLTRLIISPLVLPPLFVYLLPYNNQLLNTLLALFFVLFAFTDFLDGYCARRYNQETSWGKIFDPLADKCLVSSSFIALLAVGKLSFIWVILFLLRDFFMMGLRAYASECGVSFSVSHAAKLKTGMQMVVITLLIGQPHRYMSPDWAYFFVCGETFVLYGTLFLTYATMLDYWYHFKYALEG